jgi:antimicrobial peptide system SdpB family protein
MIVRGSSSAPWTNAFGLGRSLIALSVFLTLVLNPTSILFRPVLGVAEVPISSGFGSQISIFWILSNHLTLARWLAAGILFLVIIGWRPRITGLLHWWVNCSFISSSPIVDGGEHAATVLTLLLVPACLMDPRKWHWQPLTRDLNPSSGERQRRIIAWSSVKLVRLQVAIIYLHAAVGKCAVAEWQNGTAVYYWFTDPMFGAPQWISPVIWQLIVHPVSVVMITWGAILLEFLLFAGLLMVPRYRLPLMYLGIAFHAGIAAVHGLGSFSLVMTGALVLYLWPLNRPLRLPRWMQAISIKDRGDRTSTSPAHAPSRAAALEPGT